MRLLQTADHPRCPSCRFSILISLPGSVEWLQGEVLDKQVSYWKEKLAGAPSLLELPTDRPRPPTQSFRGARQPVVIPQELTESLRELGESQNATLFMTLLAAFEVLLFRHAGQDDIVVGVPITGRNNPELENLIGFFINTLPVRTDLSGNPTFRELLGRVREAALGAYEHQDLPFEKLVEVTPARAGHQLLTVVSGNVPSR